jgi:uncharacterized RmlC-like cupin family protein
MKRLVMILIACACAGVTAAGSMQLKGNRQGGALILKPGDVQWADYPGRPGVKMAVVEGDMSKAAPFMVLVKFPAGYKLGPHTHPGTEHATILSGSIRLGYGTKDDGPTELLTAGTILVTPPNTPHFFSVESEVVEQMHGVGPWGSTPVK